MSSLVKKFILSWATIILLFLLLWASIILVTAAEGGVFHVHTYEHLHLYQHVHVNQTGTPIPIRTAPVGVP